MCSFNKKLIIGLVSIMLLTLSGCVKETNGSDEGAADRINETTDENGATVDETGATVDVTEPETVVFDDLYHDTKTDQKIVAFKTPNDMSYYPEDEFVYVPEGEDAGGRLWTCSTPPENAADYEEGSFLLITADVILETGGEDGRQDISISALKDIKPITLEEAKEYIHIENFFEQEFDGVSGIIAFPEWDDCVFYGNIYDVARPGEEPMDLVGEVRVYHEGYVGSYNRMTQVENRTVFYNYTCDGELSDEEYCEQIGFEDWRKTQTHTPEYISQQSIEELLSTGVFYNETMFIMER